MEENDFKVPTTEDYDQDPIYTIISNKIEEEHTTSFDDLPPNLQLDIENNITTDTLYHLKQKFPFFEWPADILYRKVDNYQEVTSKTANTHIKRVTKDIPTSFQKWDPVSGVLTEYEARVVETNVKKGKKYHWELESTKILGGPNRKNFEIFEDPITRRFSVLDKETKRIFEIEDYIRKKGGWRNRDNFIRMMQPPFVEPVHVLPKPEIYYDPKTRKHFIPRDLYWRTDIEKTLISWFQYNPQLIDTNTVREEIKTIWQSLSPEQRLDFLADFSFPLFNIINETANLSDSKIYILSYGTPGSGKTLIHRLAMRFFWGFDGYFTGDQIRNSRFRLEVFSSTNLPIFVDGVSSLSEAMFWDIKGSADGGVAIKGQGNLEIKLYHYQTTLIMTAQHNVLADLGIDYEQTLTWRFFVNYYSEKVKRDAEAEYLFDDLKTRGYAIYILENTTLDELFDLYRQITEKVDDRILATLIWGARILNLTPEQLNETRHNMAENDLENLIYLVYNDYEKIEEAHSEPEKHPDLMTSGLFGNIIKKENPIPYLAINTNYLNFVNSTNHPLKGKFARLSEFNKLEKYFPKELIEKLPGGKIFANHPIHFGNNKIFKAVCLPYLYNEKAKALKFADILSNTYAELFYPQTDQQPQQSQPQEQDQQQKQDQQKPQE